MTSLSGQESAGDSSPVALPGTGAKKPRVALWDHARFALIVLVVFTHLLTTIRSDNEVAFALYVFLFLFHMPGFILLSGVFAKATVTPKLITSVWQLLLVWAIWEALWALARVIVQGEWPGSNWLVHPSWTLWFLITLATMRIMLPFIARLRYPLTFSVVVSLAAGLLPAIGVAFSASRTLTFLPFFVLGWLAKERGWFDRDWFLRPSRAVQAAAAAVLVAGASIFLLIPNLRDIWRVDKWLLGNTDYHELNAEAAPFSIDPWVGEISVGPGVRLAILVAGVLFVFAVLLVVPRTETRFTVWGSRTLFVYLLHGPIVKVLRETGVVDSIDDLGWIGVPLLFVLALAMSAVLATWIVSRVFKPIIEPNVNWLVRRDDESTVTSRR